MDNIDQAVALAERVVVLRAELKTAEDALRARLGGPPRTIKTVRLGSPAPTVAGRVRDALHDDKAGLTWAQLVDFVGGDSAKLAARAALKNLRKKKHVKFAGGRYTWIGK